MDEVLQWRIDDLQKRNTALVLENRALRGHGEVRFTLSSMGFCPTKANDSDSGWDLYSPFSLSLPSGSVRTLKTGLSIELPPMHEAQIRPRSGLSANGIWVPLGTVDSGFRGELGVIILNTTQDSYKIERGDRIAQLVVAQLASVTLLRATALTSSARGASGFGSSGR